MTRTNRIGFLQHLYVIWLIATIWHFQWGARLPFQDFAAIDFILRAGLLWGYYVCLVIIVGLIPITLAVWYRRHAQRKRMLASLGGDTTTSGRRIDETTIEEIVSRLVHVGTLFAAFYFYSEALVSKLAPFGLYVLIVIYIVRWRSNNTQD